jgi:hypothetical protein
MLSKVGWLFLHQLYFHYTFISIATNKQEAVLAATTNKKVNHWGRECTVYSAEAHL